MIECVKIECAIRHQHKVMGISTEVNANNANKIVCYKYLNITITSMRIVNKGGIQDTKAFINLVALIYHSTLVYNKIVRV